MRLTRKVFTRKPGERVRIPALGLDVMNIGSSKMKIAFQAPENVRLEKPSTEEDDADRAVFEARLLARLADAE